MRYISKYKKKFTIFIIFLVFTFLIIFLLSILNIKALHGLDCTIFYIDEDSCLADASAIGPCNWCGQDSQCWGDEDDTSFSCSIQCSNPSSCVGGESGSCDVTLNTADNINFGTDDPQLNFTTIITNGSGDITANFYIKTNNAGNRTFYTNSSVVNNSLTTIDYNDFVEWLPSETYSWFVDCTVGSGETNTSEIRKFTFKNKKQFTLKRIWNNESDMTIYGDDFSDFLGRAVSSGDINGDGIKDIIMGADSADDSQSNSGNVYVIFGSTTHNSGSIIDLNSIPANITIYGEFANQFSGRYLSSGDVNGDNIDDIIIGTFPNIASQTRVYVIYGSTSFNGNDTINLSAVNANITFIGSAFIRPRFFSARDVNGDGIDDIIFSSPNTDNSRGRIDVLYGSSNFPNDYTLDLSTDTMNITIYGNASSDLTGEGLGVGDFNNDGIDDLIFGSRGADLLGRSNAGKAHILFGRTDFPNPYIFNLSTDTTNITIYGSVANDELGFSVSSGDINGDGIEDIIIEARLADPPGGSAAGKVYVLYGNTNFPSDHIIDLNSTSANITIYGDDPSDLIGNVLDSGDINNDGIEDIIIGAFVADPSGGDQSGEVYVLYGSSSFPNSHIIDLNSEPLNITIYGNDTSDRLGDFVNLGDINNDGIEDIIIGASGVDSGGGLGAGGVYIIFGEVTVTDTTNPTATFTCSPSVVTLGDKVTCTCSGTDADSGVDTISSSTIVITDASGSFTVSGCTVTDNAGNSAIATGSYEVLSSGGGGILDLDGPSIKKIHLLPSVNPEDETKVEFDSGTGIKEIQIQVSSKASNVRIKVSKYDSKPVEVSKDISGKVYRYLEISTENLENKLEKVIVTIQVEKTWISDQGLNKEDVRMFKFKEDVEEWNELETVFDSEDTDFYIYSIELDSLSFFVIGEKVTGEVVEMPPIKEKINLTWIWILIFLIGIVVLVIIYFVRKKREEEIYNS